MLTELTIRDFAIIDQLTLRLHRGFNVLTGETGAGKSIIVDAVELLLGGRGDSTVVRAGAKRAIVEGVFRLEPSAQARLNPLLEENGLEGDTPDVLLLGREVRTTGRSVARVNGRAVTLTLLRRITDGLVDIHGQSEHLSLLQVRAHLDLLDRYAELWELRTQVAEKVATLRAVRRELDTLLRDERVLARRADLLQFQIEEIGGANLRPGEEMELVQERNRLANAEQLAALVDEALGALREADGEGDAGAAIDLIDQAMRALTALSKLDPELKSQREALESLFYQLDDLSTGLRDYREALASAWDPKRLRQVEDRLDLIYRLKRKYGDSIEAILAFAANAAAELETITHSEERVEELRAQETTLLEEVGALASDLSVRRREAAQHLSEDVEFEMTDLKMEGARFGVDFQWQEAQDGIPIPPHPELPSGESRLSFDASGIDRVEFLVSPNPGEGLKPMIKIASGGETARLMLALKTVLSRADETPTLIFDEIDQGIGGRVGATVGLKLYKLTVARLGSPQAARLGSPQAAQLDAPQAAQLDAPQAAQPDSAQATDGDAIEHQVLCVTHLPQLAGYGDRHFKVEKQVVPSTDPEQSEQRTVTGIRRLEGDARVEELAQMLGLVSDSTRESARAILARVQESKAVQSPEV